MSDAQREIERIMRDAGFRVVRQNKHLVWSDGKVKIHTSVSASKCCGDKIRKIITKARAR